jgi:hypothetical protein
MAERPVSIREAAAYFGVEEADILAAIKAGTIPRYGSGQGRVKASDVLDALNLHVCPTCREPVGRPRTCKE